jgi:hypothetical protein
MKFIQEKAQTMLIKVIPVIMVISNARYTILKVEGWRGVLTTPSCSDKG